MLCFEVLTMVAMKTTQDYIQAGSIMKLCYLKKVWNKNGKENCLNIGFQRDVLQLQKC